MSRPEIAILVSSFERPGHLRRVLASIAAQRGVRGALEVVVTDDGSRDETPRLVRRFAAAASFPVRFTTHPHGVFHIARCRNEGVAASTAPYLLFLDGDCIIPPDHVRAHLDHRRESVAMAGYPIYLNRDVSEKITPGNFSAESLEQHATWAQRVEMRWRHLRSQFYSLVGDRQRPKLMGGNLGIARADYERVNGYDENFQGWGCEDDDLGLRLRSCGMRVQSIAWWTHTYHLWHPKTPTAPRTWRAGSNVEYFRRPLRLTRCLNGLIKRRPQDVSARVVGRRFDSPALDAILPSWCRVALAARAEPAEIEFAVAGNEGIFSSTAACRILIVPSGQTADRTLASRAQLVFADDPVAGMGPDRRFPLRLCGAVIEQHLGMRSSLRASTGAAGSVLCAAG